MDDLREKLQDELEDIYSEIVDYEITYKLNKTISIMFSRTIKAYGKSFTEEMTLNQAKTILKLDTVIKILINRIKTVANKYGYTVEISDIFMYYGD